MPKRDRFPETELRELAASKILGVRSGAAHKYTGVWPIVLEGRLFVRSWNDKPAGWFRAFLDEPEGTIQVAGLEIPVRATLVRSARLRDAVTLAYGRKYNTKGSQKWVEGFAQPERASNTLEFMPR